MILPIQTINSVLLEVADLIKLHKEDLLSINKIDILNYAGADLTLTERLKIDDAKCVGMINSLHALIALPNPVGNIIYTHTNTQGLIIQNQTAPFGTILIIYESRPDVTIEAAAIAFKSGNKILLKGGKEAHGTNFFLTSLWHKALSKFNVPLTIITYLALDRLATQNYLKNNTNNIDLVVPRGGNTLIDFVKNNCAIPMLISGRGNNFIYIDEQVDNAIIEPILVNAKLQNLSACNALDKVLVNKNWLCNNEVLWYGILNSFKKENVQIIQHNKGDDNEILNEEFLDAKLLWKTVEDNNEAINIINTYSGKHSAAILSTNINAIAVFNNMVDSAAVYSNASTRFTDGGQFGLGAELAISTGKLHHRGPLGLQHLVTNKWIITGNGQIRK